MFLHLVEISPALCRIQEEKLCPADGGPDDPDSDSAYKTKVTSSGVPVAWYRCLRDVPPGFSFYVANEFFDALPVHQLRKTEKGWREVLIDVNPGGGGLRYVLSRDETPSVKLYQSDEGREAAEVSFESGVVIQQLADRMKEEGGFALVIDYGHDGDRSDTFRAFRGHKPHHPLEDPGSADLTADVDFSYLRRAVGDRALTYGPLSQAEFLERMGVELRLQRLLQGAEPETSRQLKSGYRELTDPDRMGERFKFFALFPVVLRDLLRRYPPAAWDRPTPPPADTSASG